MPPYYKLMLFVLLVLTAASVKSPRLHIVYSQQETTQGSLLID